MKKKSAMQKLRRKQRHAAGLAKPRVAKTEATPRQRWDVKINGKWVPLGRHYRKPKIGGKVLIGSGGRYAKVQDVRGT